MLELAAQGMTDKQIGATLGITLRTVSTYWARLREKLQADNRAHAVSIMQRETSDVAMGRLRSEQSESQQVLERQLAQARAAQSAAEDELAKLYHALAHNFHTPLRSIVAHSTVLSREHADGLAREAVDHMSGIKTSASRLSSMMDAMAQYTRLRSLPLNRQRVRLDELVAECITEMRRRNPKCRMEFLCQEGLEAHADSACCRLALWHLLDNARKFGEGCKSPHVQIGRDGSGAFFVRDDGIGFSNEYRHRIFEPFERLHPEDAYPGAGMGLSVVRRAIERHGGQAWAESQPGQGATVYFTLPN